jgi:hypothetical protein
MRQRDAVLHVVLARIAAAVDYKLKLPAPIGTPQPLCYFALTVAGPGGGKSDANGIGAEILRVNPDRVADQLPGGSGEGMAEVLFDSVQEPDADGKTHMVKRQVRHNAFIYIDEGDMVAALSERSGSTTLSTLRSIWSGKSIGQNNATKERKRIVPAGSYTFGVVVGIQETKTGPIIADAGAGTPQRFAWAEARDPSLSDTPPQWPGSLDWHPPLLPLNGDVNADLDGNYYMELAEPVADEIRRNDLLRNRGEVRLKALDAHADLLRLKIAGLLAILDGRLNITEEDWYLAGIVKATSDKVLAHAQAVLSAETERAERATATKLADRQVRAMERTQDFKVVKQQNESEPSC